MLTLKCESQKFRRDLSERFPCHTYDIRNFLNFLSERACELKLPGNSKQLPLFGWGSMCDTATPP